MRISDLTCTTQKLILGDARNLGFLADASVHLVITSPPYWNLNIEIARHSEGGICRVAEDSPTYRKSKK